MVIAPNSDVILLKSPLELSQSHQINFANANAQYNYFYGLPKLIVGTDFTYQRKDQIIRVDRKVDDIYQYNYVMYRNDNYSSKWFYAFINKMEYVNDNCTYIYIKTDVFQTWQFDLTYKQTFVEREHTNNDTIGSNTVDEGLEFGEYIIQSTNDIDITNSQAYQTKSPFVCIGVTETPNKLDGVTVSAGVWPNDNKFNGIPSGLTYVMINSDDIRKFTRVYDKNTKADAIINMFIIPALYIEKVGSAGHLNPTTFSYDDNGSTVSVGCFTFNNSEDSYNLGTPAFNAPNSIDGYTPKNKKLLVYPYCFNRLTNNGGTDVVYRWEDFTNRQAQFRIEASIAQGMSIKAFPQNYLKGGGNANEYEYGITGQKFPTCSWSTDFYVAWVNQQGANLALQTGIAVGNTILGGAAAAVAGGANIATTGAGLVGAGLNVVSQIGNTMQKIREAQLVPDQAKGNVNSGDVNFSVGKSGFTSYSMTIKAEFARQIDDYFNMFGYKTNRVKVPNVTGRQNWNYVKTIDCYIAGDIPQDDLQEIKNMFNNGLTIWHNTSNFMNYGASNNIV